MSTEAGIIFLVGRILFVGYFLSAAYLSHWLGRERAVGYGRSKGMPFPELGGWPTTVLLTVASAMIVLGLWADIALLALAAFVLTAAYFFHDFWAVPAEQRSEQRSNFIRNLTLAGACLALFALWAEAGEAFKYTVTDQLIDLS